MSVKLNSAPLKLRRLLQLNEPCPSHFLLICKLEQLIVQEYITS